MGVLNPRKIRWIMRELEKGELSAYRIAKMQGVSPRRVRQLPRKYGGVGPYGIAIQKPGRRPMPISIEDEKMAKEIYDEFPMGP